MDQRHGIGHSNQECVPQKLATIGRHEECKHGMVKASNASIYEISGMGTYASGIKSRAVMGKRN